MIFVLVVMVMVLAIMVLVMSIVVVVASIMVMVTATATAAATTRGGHHNCDVVGIQCHCTAERNHIGPRSPTRTLSVHPPPGRPHVGSSPKPRWKNPVGGLRPNIQ